MMLKPVKLLDVGNKDGVLCVAERVRAGGTAGGASLVRPDRHARRPQHCAQSYHRTHDVPHHPGRPLSSEFHSVTVT